MLEFIGPVANTDGVVFDDADPLTYNVYNCNDERVDKWIYAIHYRPRRKYRRGRIG